MVVQATEADDPALVPVPPPDLGEGPTSRTVQWFLFSAVAVIGYPLLLLQRPRRHGMSEVEPATACWRRWWPWPGGPASPA